MASARRGVFDVTEVDAANAREHKARAERVLGPLRAAGMAGDEMAVVIAHRLRKATENFIAKRGFPDTYSTMLDLMSALQVAHN